MYNGRQQENKIQVFTYNLQ